MSMKMNKMGLGAMLSLAVSGFATQASAQSSDVKSYPSSMCQGSSDASYAAGYAWMGGGGTLYCPMVKDRYGSTYNQNSYVSVHDISSSYDLSCTLVLMDTWGGWSDWDSDTTSGTPGNDTLFMSVDSGSSSVSSNYVTYCFWPSGPGSQLTLRSYRMYEYNTNE